MFCPKCGFENSNDNKFCLNCGSLVKSTDSAKIKKKATPLSKVILFILVASLVGTGAYFGTTFLLKSFKNSNQTEDAKKNSEDNYTGLANTRGNTVGNIANGGYVAEQDGWIYYRNTAINSSLYKIKIDDTQKTQVCLDKIEYINVIGNWIYYSNESDHGYIYKIKIDGSERTKLNDAESKSLNVLDGYIYYVNVTDGNKLYKIKTDGKENIKINDDKAESPVVLDGWIYYINVDSNKTIYKISITGTDYTLLGGKDGAKCLNASGSTLYYINDWGSLFVIGMDGMGYDRINDGGDVYGDYYKTLHTINIEGSIVFFSNMRLLSMDLGIMDESSPIWNNLYTQEWVTRIHIIGEWIYFTDQPGNLSRIKNDGTEYMLVS